MANEFGRILRDRRESVGFGLREFADLVGVKASNLSDVENQKKKPHFQSEVLIEMASHLKYVQHSEEWYRFFDAAKKVDQLPADTRVALQDHEEAVTSLLRTVSKLQLTEEKIRELDQWIEKQWGVSTNDV